MFFSCFHTLLFQKAGLPPPIPEVEQDGIDEGWFWAYPRDYIHSQHRLISSPHDNACIVAAELLELQQEIIRLQDSIESTIDDRRHIDIEMSKLDRKVKMDKALAIDQHHQKVQQYRLPTRCV